MTESSKPRHAAPMTADPPIPEPPFPERARTLVHVARTGTLATVSARRPGYPFASVMPYALDADGRPLLLISDMAVHTDNLGADARASLLVLQPGFSEDPLAGGRVTLIGTVTPVPDADRAAAREAYLARHDRARYWVDFDDFRFWRMAIEDVYLVAGFGAMGWIGVEDYVGAAADPLADAAEAICSHMNADHADALVLYARHFARLAADAAEMVGVDRMGFRLRVQTSEGLKGARVNFPEDVRTADDARRVLIAMLRTARGEG